MARELGLNPATLGKLDNYKQEGWKLPLPAYIEHLHLKRFGKSCPAAGASLEERGKPVERKAAAQSDSTQPVLDLFAAGPSGERTPELDDGA